jgi:hypothetical protein
MSCNKHKQSPNKPGQCDPNKCNPFMTCAAGNFYTIVKSNLESHAVINWAEKIIPQNDNRLATCICDFWHPPEEI